MSTILSPTHFQMVRDASLSKTRRSHFDVYIISMIFQRLLTTGTNSPTGGVMTQRP